MSKLPKFKSEEEFAKFVENHDMAEYWDEFEDIPQMKIGLPRPTKKALTMRIYPYLLEQIKRLAAERGVPYQVLIQQWLTEKVREERRAS